MDQVCCRPDVIRLQAGALELLAIDAAIAPRVPDQGAQAHILPTLHVAGRAALVSHSMRNEGCLAIRVLEHPVQAASADETADPGRNQLSALATGAGRVAVAPERPRRSNIRQRSPSNR